MTDIRKLNIWDKFIDDYGQEQVVIDKYEDENGCLFITFVPVSS